MPTVKPNKSEEITERQKEVLKAIYKSLRDSGYPPTLADLREELDVSSNQTVLDLLKILENKGFIKKEEGMARGLKILQKGFEALGAQPIMPYVGISAGGQYMHAFEDIEWKAAGEIETTVDLFVVKVKGDSMIGAGIHDGDAVLVRYAKEFKNGDIVLARSNDGTTIKKLVYDNGRIYLKPENPKHKNIPIYPKTHLVGKVVQVIRKN